jgi:hypothetical protein
MSNVGKWDSHYRDLPYRLPYGDPRTYEMIGRLVGRCDLVEDWGCGGGALAHHLLPGTTYRGLDGSVSPFADEQVDLVSYRSSVPAVVLRGVLEHNDNWKTVLDNAVASFTDTLVLVLFTPLVHETTVLFREPDYGDVPVIAFRLGDVLDRMPERTVHWTAPSPDTVFGTETFIVAYR